MDMNVKVDTRLIDALMVLRPMGTGLCLVAGLWAIFAGEDLGFWQAVGAILGWLAIGALGGCLAAVVLYAFVALPVLFFGRDWFDAFPNWATRRQVSGSFLEDVKNHSG